MSYVNYYFDFFNKFQPFNFYTNQEVIEVYAKGENKLTQQGYHRQGNFSGPYDSSFQPTAAGKKPVRHYITNKFSDITHAKADLTSMDLKEKGTKWDKWIYFTIPKEFILENQTTVLDNKIPKLVNIFKQFCIECIEKNLTKIEIIKLAQSYDKKYSDPYPLDTNRPMRPGWRFDLEVSMFYSVLTQGIVFPIAYNNTSEIFERGTHRSLIFALTGNDIPVFVQNRIDFNDRNKRIFNTHTNFNPNEFKLEFLLEEKKLEIFNKNNEKISSFNSRS